MKTKHTQEPWNFQMVDVALGEIKHGVITAKRDATDYCKANPRIAIVDHIERGEGEANAARIVACVNGCKGVNPDAVPDMLAIIKELHQTINGLNATMRATSLEYRASPLCEALNDLARRNAGALAKARGNLND